MLSVLRDEGATPMERMDAAKAAAPYVHPRLAAIEHAGNVEKPVRFDAGLERPWGYVGTRR
jgi:hypothetical protein